MSIETPSYTVLVKSGPVEYRRYEPYLVAETLVENDGRYKDAGNEGFRRLFRYITGGNTAQQKISMTAPVEQSSATADTGRKIAMTAPVEQAAAREGWTVSFMVPSVFTMDTLPQPTDARVRIRQVPAEIRAVLRYSGRWTDKLFASKREELMELLDEQGVEVVGVPQSALYDPPYKLPFMRRNEVQVRVTGTPDQAARADAAGLALWAAR